MNLFSFALVLLASQASALVISPAVNMRAASVGASPVVMGAKKAEGDKSGPFSLADFLSAPMGGRELLNGSAPDRKKKPTPEEYDTRRFKTGFKGRSGTINPKDASTW